MLVGGDAALARALLVAKAAAALADRSPEAVAQALPEAVQLAELMLTCLSLGESSSSSCALKAECVTSHIWLHGPC